MSLNQMISDFLAKNKIFIVVYLINSFLLLLYLYYSNGFSEIIFPFWTSLFVLFVYLILAGYKFYHLRQKIEAAKYSPNIDFDFTDIKEKMIFETTNAIHANYQKELYDLKVSYNNRNSLFTQWIHNMKVSISIIDLASRKGRDLLDETKLDFLEDIIEENNKLKVNLEESLNILRMDDFSRDYIPETVGLNKVVSDVINSKKKDFIYRGVFPKVRIESDIEVYTDYKWCSYIIDQILSNSIKYSPANQNKSITIEANDETKKIFLIIKDEGIGIPEEDLPRVFQPFFTGQNGRTHSSASGIGLYMVKYISEKLGHELKISSEVGKGTILTISFLKAG